MNKMKLLSLLMFLILGAASVQAQQSKPVITLERTACFGACPVYTVNIFEDGTVVYNGQDFVTVTGEQTSQIEPETVQDMIKAFESAGYFDWNTEYKTQKVTDLPYVTTSVTHNGETHRIEHYLGDDSAPLALSFLEQFIDAMTNSALWTGVQPDPAAISNGTDTPFITLERTACFGECPVYNIALFEDGTVVYTGIAHVDKIGVYVSQQEAAAITSVAQRAEIFGYFGWKDSYENHVMTDQPTVTTSIRWNDQFKRIVRYDGDPNAPVGLLRIEEYIDQIMK